MDAREMMGRFLGKVHYLDESTIGRMVGMPTAAFNRWMNNCGFPRSQEKYNVLVVRFLESTGKKLEAIQDDFESGRITRLQLHKKRSEIFKKHRHTPLRNRACLLR